MEEAYPTQVVIRKSLALNSSAGRQFQWNNPACQGRFHFSARMPAAPAMALEDLLAIHKVML